MMNGQTEPVEPVAFSNRGAIIRLFGVILIILGTLDMMLSWRGSLEIVPFHAMIFVTGVVLCLIGAIRRHVKS
jgi:hypothetical protein